ncbi:helicase-like protein [Aphelenchoides avenae]|nr:helicase-like protein [Aphelenchus avenae]
MRVTAGEREFSLYLAQLARGATTVKPSIFRFARNTYELIDFCFPESELQDPFAHAQEFGQRAILAPHRQTVALINDLVIGYLPGDARIYYSEQNPENAEGPGEFSPHELVLKKGAILMLVRNLSLEDKLCNGMRFMLEDMNDRFLMCCSLLDGQQHKFYRMTFTAKDFTRKQFPVIRGYALTITRAQGCTLDRMSLHLEKDCFAHGSLFTALSRVRSKESVRVLYSKPRPIRNVVYKEFLE